MAPSCANSEGSWDPNKQDALAELSQLAVSSRYPGDDGVVDLETAKKAVGTARSVKDAVLAAVVASGAVI
jgi:hypothetical protein